MRSTMNQMVRTNRNPVSCPCQVSRTLSEEHILSLVSLSRSSLRNTIRLGSKSSESLTAKSSWPLMLGVLMTETDLSWIWKSRLKRCTWLRPPSTFSRIICGKQYRSWLLQTKQRVLKAYLIRHLQSRSRHEKITLLFVQTILTHLPHDHDNTYRTKYDEKWIQESFRESVMMNFTIQQPVIGNQSH